MEKYNIQNIKEQQVACIFGKRGSGRTNLLAHTLNMLCFTGPFEDRFAGAYFMSSSAHARTTILHEFAGSVEVGDPQDLQTLETFCTRQINGLRHGSKVCIIFDDMIYESNKGRQPWSFPYTFQSTYQLTRYPERFQSLIIYAHSNCPVDLFARIPTKKPDSYFCFWDADEVKRKVCNMIACERYEDKLFPHGKPEDFSCVVVANNKKYIYKTSFKTTFIPKIIQDFKKRLHTANWHSADIKLIFSG